MSVVTFSKKRNLISHEYMFSNQNVFRSTQIKDFRIIFDSKLLFNFQIIAVKKKALSFIGTIKRNFSSFNNPFTLKCLYTSIVRPIFEYAPIIWEIYGIAHCEQLEKIQNNMLSFIFFKYNLYRPPHSGYKNILNFINLRTLKDRKNNFV